MADFMFIVVVIGGFFALAWGLVIGCDRIVGPDDGVPEIESTPEVTT